MVAEFRSLFHAKFIFAPGNFFPTAQTLTGTLGGDNNRFSGWVIWSNPLPCIGSTGHPSVSSLHIVYSVNAKKKNQTIRTEMLSKTATPVPTLFLDLFLEPGLDGITHLKCLSESFVMQKMIFSLSACLAFLVAVWSVLPGRPKPDNLLAKTAIGLAPTTLSPNPNHSDQACAEITPDAPDASVLRHETPFGIPVTNPANSSDSAESPHSKVPEPENPGDELPLLSSRKDGSSGLRMRNIYFNNSRRDIIPESAADDTSQFVLNLAVESPSQTVTVPTATSMADPRTPSTDPRSEDMESVLSHAPTLADAQSAGQIVAAPGPVHSRLQSPWGTPLELPPEFRRRAAMHVEQGNKLARRGATATARGKFVQALSVIADGRDSVHPDNRHNKSLETALQILDDVRDFFADSSSATDQVNPSFVVGTHVCGALSAEEAAAMTLTEVRMRYLESMQRHFAAACGQEPLAAAALSSLGKLYAIKLNASGSSHECEWNIAMAFLETALECNPSDARSANEMGVLLARVGEYGRARNQFLVSLGITRNATTLTNLATLHNLLGEHELAAGAAQAAAMVAQQSRASGEGLVQWVDPQAFGENQEGFDTMPETRTAAAPFTEPSSGPGKPNLFQNPFKR